jgi:hypothetical protein
METVFFAVLVPHRDCLPALNHYRSALFAAGLEGAWAFPAAAPLARLSRPLETGELKTAAVELRSLLGDRVISPLEEGECAGWDSYRFFGTMLDLPFPSLPADSVLQRWEKPILAPVILTAGDSLTRGDHAYKLPSLVSSAAALANLALTPVKPEQKGEFAAFEADYSFIWELGPLLWLPRRRKRHV